MATLRNKRKLAAVTRETKKEPPWNGQSRNTSVPGFNEESITQVPEEIEGRVTKKLSQEFSRTESRILDALSKLDEFLLNPQVRTCSVAIPGTSRNGDSGNWKPNGDRSSNDPCPEAMVSSHHSGNLNSPEVEEYPHKYHNTNRLETNKKHLFRTKCDRYVVYMLSLCELHRFFL